MFSPSFDYDAAAADLVLSASTTGKVSAMFPAVPRIAGFLLAALSAGAAPVIEKVEPPNWWVKHTRNPVQILITGKDLRGARLTSKTLKVETRQSSKDGRYLFAYVDIAGARAGTHRFQVTGASGPTGFDFVLLDAQRPRLRPFDQDDVIYLLMTDRFANGDASNDSPPEFRRPADRSTVNAYHGGDFRGIRQRLPYLKALGVTGIWLLPVYQNSSIHSSPAHGYHTVDFYAAETRFGGMAEFQELVAEAHRLGMKVMQDQVANHCGPYHPWVEAPPTRSWFHDLEKLPRLRNNFDIAALADPYARPSRRAVPLRGWFAGHLPDFDQTDPLLSDYVIQNALWWIGMTGVDGIRQDTYPYADRPFWEKWQAAIERQFPGFFVVGEITANTPAVLSFFEGGERRAGFDTGLTTMLDFPLERAMRSVFAQGEPMTQLTDILAQDSLYRRPELLVTFLGNHDQPRFLTIAGGEVERLLMAQTFLLTTRGIPHLYYGDEVALGKGQDRTDRSIRADFPGGFPGDAIDAFTAQGRAGVAATVFDSLRALLHLRREHAALRRGTLTQLVADKDRYAYYRATREDAILVAFNRSREEMELALDDLEIPDGTRFKAWPQGTDAVVTAGKVRLAPAPVRIYIKSQ
jgi:glycosidase